MKNLWKYFLCAFVGVVTSALILLFWESDEVKFVSMASVFAESNIKKEYEIKLNDFEEKSNKSLQEIQDKIKSAEANGVDPNQVLLMRQELTREQQALSEQYSEMSETFQETVWNELNIRIEKYGKEQGFKFILGGTGDGTIMYANEADDITEELIKYINKK